MIVKQQTIKDAQSYTEVKLSIDYINDYWSGFALYLMEKKILKQVQDVIGRSIGYKKCYPKFEVWTFQTGWEPNFI